MGKYWVSSPIVLVDHGTGKVVGRVVAKRKRAGVWNIICHGRGRETYLLCLKIKEPSSSPWDHAGPFPLIGWLCSERAFKACY